MKNWIAMLALLCAANLHAAPTSFGAPDCGSWIAAPSPAHKAWLMGFLSGVNAMWKGSDPLDQVTNANQFFVWMDNYCRAHPLNKVTDGGVDLYIELVDRVNPKK